MVFITPQPGRRPDDTKADVPVGGTIISTNTPLAVGELAQDAAPTDSAIYLVDASQMTETGRVFIDNEEIEYTRILGNRLTGCVRGRGGTTAVAHTSGTAVPQIYASKIFDMRDFTQINLELFSTAPGTFFGQWYIDPSNPDTSRIIRNFRIAYTSLELETTSTLRLTRYARILFVPTATQEAFMLNFNLLTTAVSGQTVGLTSFVAASMIVNLGRNVIMGQRPDGDFVNSPADGAAWSTDIPLESNGRFVSEWTDSDGWNSIEIFAKADVLSALHGIVVEFTDNTRVVDPVVLATKHFSLSAYDIDRGQKTINLPPLLDGFRITYINGAKDQALFYLTATLKTNQSNVAVGPGRALRVSEFETDVVLGAVDNFEYVVVEGRETAITTGTDKDMWGGAGNYVGQTLTTPGIVSIVSTASKDTAGGVGARSVRLTGLESAEAVEYATEMVTLNGKRAVATKRSWFRVILLEVMTAGAAEYNRGVITATAPNNVVLARINSGLNRSMAVVYTVPANRKLLIKRFYVVINRTQGRDGSAVCQLMAREPGSVYRPALFHSVTTGAQYVDNYRGGRVFPAGTDLKAYVTDISLAHVTDISSNGTTIESGFEGFLIAI